MTFETNQKFIKIGFVAILLMIPTHYLLDYVSFQEDSSSFLSKSLKFLFVIEVICAVFLFGIYGWLARFESEMTRGYYNALSKKNRLHIDDRMYLRKNNVLKRLGLWVEKSGSSNMEYKDKK